MKEKQNRLTAEISCETYQNINNSYWRTASRHSCAEGAKPAVALFCKAKKSYGVPKVVFFERSSNIF